MDVLKLSFVNGETVDFPFSVDSMLSVETPDGVNGTQRGAWGEIAHVEYVTAQDEPVSGESQPDVAAVADEPPVEPDPAPADAVPPEEPTPDPLVAVSSDDSGTASEAATGNPSTDPNAPAAA